ncbi:aldolase/citrate lyase family protein [soil metagenome]
MPLHPSVVLQQSACAACLPVCDHYAGNEKSMRKSLALQAELATAAGPVFDITFDCEDGAASGAERDHAIMAASLLAGTDNRFGRVGVRVHDFRHPAVHDDLEILFTAAGDRIAYVVLPKVADLDEAERFVDLVRATTVRHGLPHGVPVHVLIESPSALTDVARIAALPAVECLSFGLMDFVSAHGGAIPAAAMTSPGQFDHPLVRRAKLEISAACHAHSKTPSHNVTTRFDDPAHAGADAARAAAEFGYTRMWSIHPAQVRAIVAALQPPAEAVDEAAAILLRAREAEWGPTRQDQHGRSVLHDRASYRFYWDLLRRARAAGVPIDATTEHIFFEETRP